MSDMTEIEAAKIAEQKGNAEQKKFAAMIVSDQHQDRTELKSMVTEEIKIGNSVGAG